MRSEGRSDPRPSGQQSEGNDRDPVVATVGVFAGGDDHLVDEAPTDAIAQPVEVPHIGIEDSILISEKVAADDRYTSIHIEELNVVAVTPSWVRKILPVIFRTCPSVCKAVWTNLVSFISVRKWKPATC